MRVLYEKLGDTEAWTSYITDLREKTLVLDTGCQDSSLKWRKRGWPLPRVVLTISQEGARKDRGRRYDKEQRTHLALRAVREGISF